MEQIGKRVFDSAAPVQVARDDREAVYLFAELRVEGLTGTAKVRVRNLSAGGLMAEMPDPVPPDSIVEIKVGELDWVQGRVAWQTEGRAGIAFDHEIDLSHAQPPRPAD